MSGDYRVSVVGGEGVVACWPAGVVVVGGGSVQAALVLKMLTGDSPKPPESGVLLERLLLPVDADVAAAVSTPTGFRLITMGAGQAGLYSSVGTRGNAVGERDENGVSTSEQDLVGFTEPMWIGIANHPANLPEEMLDLAGGTVPGRGAVLRMRSTVVGVARLPTDFKLVDFSAGPEPDEQDHGLGEAPRPREPLPLADQVAALKASDHALSLVDGRNEAQSNLGPSQMAPQGSQSLESVPGEPVTLEPVTLEPVPSDTQDESASLVMGIECARDHFNNPLAAYCQVCGTSMVHRTHNLVSGTRPTLGFLVFDDGSTFALDRSYLLGREPNPALYPGLQPLAIDDIDHTVSREHLELKLDGWDVVAHDLGSTNGSFYWDNAATRWERIVANRPVVIRPGSTVATGRKTFVYEPVARSVE